MNKTYTTLITVFLAAAMSLPSHAANPASSPVTSSGPITTGRSNFRTSSPATTPASSYRQPGRSAAYRYSRPSNTFPNISNNIITGNVTGGKQFRGSVPYRTAGDFMGNLGTSQLDYFLRDTAHSVPGSGGVGQSQPYYFPSRSTASYNTLFLRKQQSNMEYHSKYTKGRGTDGKRLEVSARSPYSSMKFPTIPESYLQTDPQSYQYSRLADKIEQEYQKQLKEKPLDEQDPFDQQIMKIMDRDRSLEMETQLEQPQKETDIPRDKLDRQQDADKDGQPADMKQYQERLKEERDQTEQRDLFEQMREENLKRLHEQIMYPGGKEPDEDEASEEETNQSQLRKQAKLEGIENVGEEYMPEMEGIELTEEQRKKARDEIKKHKTFAAMVDNKFNMYMKAAEDFMKVGKYNTAVDSYELASVFKPEDPLPYAGKSLALLCSGEYLSSSYALNMAILLYPDYPRTRVDLASLTGSMEQIEKRISDINRWYERSQAGELMFLLAYINLQLENYQQAYENIQEASIQMPYEQSIKRLETVIKPYVKEQPKTEGSSEN
jgi:tetratricopeptide (TPR) repeat protein